MSILRVNKIHNPSGTEAISIDENNATVSFPLNSTSTFLMSTLPDIDIEVKRPPLGLVLLDGP